MQTTHTFFLYMWEKKIISGKGNEKICIGLEFKQYYYTESYSLWKVCYQTLLSLSCVTVTQQLSWLSKVSDAFTLNTFSIIYSLYSEQFVHVKTFATSTCHKISTWPLKNTAQTATKADTEIVMHYLTVSGADMNLWHNILQTIDLPRFKNIENRIMRGIQCCQR